MPVFLFESRKSRNAALCAAVLLPTAVLGAVPVQAAPSLAQPTLTVSRRVVNVGESLVIRWSIAGIRETASLSVLDTTSMQDLLRQDISSTAGRVEFIVPDVFAGKPNTFEVRLQWGTQVIAREVSVRCAERWFFTPGIRSACPGAETMATDAAVQDFERGRLFFFRESSVGEFVIFAIYRDRSGQQVWRSYHPDVPASTESALIENLSPPDNRYVPERGFGELWRRDAELRQTLGWATQPEVPYKACMDRIHGQLWRVWQLYANDSAGRVLELTGFRGGTIGNARYVPRARVTDPGCR